MTRGFPSERRTIRIPAMAGCALALLFGMALEVGAQEPAFAWDASDPRIGLAPGYLDAESAAWNMILVGHVARPDGFENPDALGDLNFANSDLAFRGSHVVVGSFHGFQIYDVSDPSAPDLRVAVVCPGGQGDVSIFGDLVFMSVEQTRGRIDCGSQGAPDRVDPERFRGVRIFDISDLESPRQVAAVQTCRGSHTHSLLAHPGDDENVYVYVSGAAGVRPAEELEGCSGLGADEDPETSLFRIEVIQVPLASPEDARVVSAPRVFVDEDTRAVDGLWPGGQHGEGTQRSSQTNHCHDITLYPEIGLAAGACSGNGILLDISDPVNPQRVDEVIDENFAYWHSATFNNDGTKVIFTDEWGGGTSPRCRESDPLDWGANAIFEIVDGRMERLSYYKLPVPQTEQENCVAHNGSLVPVPGRDIKVQAWYQGGISVFDFTDGSEPFEIAFFDRGPMDEEDLLTAGHWSAYWYNGYIYGSEIARGLDVLRLEPSEHLSENELEAASLVRFDEFNPQHQPRMHWPAHPAVPASYLDQLERNAGLPGTRIAEVRAALDRLGTGNGASEEGRGLQPHLDALRADLRAGVPDPVRVEALIESLEALVHAHR